MGQHKVWYEFEDYSGEFAEMTIHTYAVTALNLGTFTAQVDVLSVWLDAITLGQIVNNHWVGDETILDNTPPSNPKATRKMYWEVVYEGDVVKRDYPFAVRVATPDTSKLGFFRDRVDLSQPQIAAFVTAFETLVRNPLNTLDSVTVLYIQLRGRKYKW